MKKPPPFGNGFGKVIKLERTYLAVITPFISA